MSTEIFIDKVNPEDAEDFANIMEISAPQLFPEVFGPSFKSIFKSLFINKNNLFSFENVNKAMFKGNLAGMILAYDHKMKKREGWRTVKLIIKYMGFEFCKRFLIFMKLNQAIASLLPGDYYISNIGVYTEYRNKGIGTALLLHIEKEAIKAGIKRLVLDVESYNTKAIKLYEKLRFMKESESIININNKSFGFYKMTKKINNIV